jgi:hypothetical protein
LQQETQSTESKLELVLPLLLKVFSWLQKKSSKAKPCLAKKKGGKLAQQA